MELYQLRSFAAVARIRNLTRAAKALNISQSALSSQVRALEEELGLSLFARSAKGMALTDSGRVILTHAREVLDAGELLQQKAMHLNGRVSGSVTIGLNTDPNFLKVSRVNKLLTSAYPDLNVIFLASQTILTKEMLEQGMIDVGFCFGQTVGEKVAASVVAEVSVCVVIPRRLAEGGRAFSWQEIAAMPWIWSDCDCPYYLLFQREFDRFGLKPNQRACAVDENIIKELVKAGQGLALMREDDANALVADGHVTIWEEKRITVPLNLAWLEKRGKEEKLSAVRRLIGQCWSAVQENSRKE